MIPRLFSGGKLANIRNARPGYRVRRRQKAGRGRPRARPSNTRELEIEWSKEQKEKEEFSSLFDCVLFSSVLGLRRRSGRWHGNWRSGGKRGEGKRNRRRSRDWLRRHRRGDGQRCLFVCLVCVCGSLVGGINGYLPLPNPRLFLFIRKSVAASWKWSWPLRSSYVWGERRRRSRAGGGERRNRGRWMRGEGRQQRGSNALMKGYEVWELQRHEPRGPGVTTLKSQALTYLSSSPCGFCYKAYKSLSLLLCRIFTGWRKSYRRNSREKRRKRNDRGELLLN